MRFGSSATLSSGSAWRSAEPSTGDPAWQRRIVDTRPERVMAVAWPLRRPGAEAGSSPAKTTSDATRT